MVTYCLPSLLRISKVGHFVRAVVYFGIMPKISIKKPLLLMHKAMDWLHPRTAKLGAALLQREMRPIFLNMLQRCTRHNNGA